MIDHDLVLVILEGHNAAPNSWRDSLWAGRDSAILMGQTPIHINCLKTRCVPSRLSVGQTVRVLQRLNMRNRASIDATLIQTNPTNIQVEIIDGPVCTPAGDGASLGWQIRLGSGAAGWSAETPLNEASYFMEPIP